MVREVTTTGRLIALEGSRGRDLAAAARRLLRHFSRRDASGGISSWDASHVFFELQLGDPTIAGPSPRTLLLLYASDLAFRLRWEIRPALGEGQCVVAASYVETAMAFGRAAGLPQRWLGDLFSFAPKPDACYRVREPDSHSSRHSKLDGYLEFCCAALEASSRAWKRTEIHSKFTEYLDALERRGGCKPMDRQIVLP